MPTRYLIVADPVATLNTEFDLGVCVSKELLARGIEVDYMDLVASDPNQPTEKYLSELPVQQILAADGSRDPFWELAPARTAPVTDYQVILQRKDPPVDDLFRAYGNHFAQAPSNILQINRPPATHEFQEHTIHLRYPEYAAPTWVCESFEELVAAVRRQPTEAVAKPLGTYCGVGVNFLDPNESEERLREFWEEWKPAATVQPYLKEIQETGDLRILTIGTRVLGAVLRVPQPGSRLANLHAGGKAAFLEPTPRQLEAVRSVAEDLNQHGLYLLGHDFIGEYITEVNFTSPTLVLQINKVMGKRSDLELIDELERMRVAMSGR